MLRHFFLKNCFPFFLSVQVVPVYDSPSKSSYNVFLPKKNKFLSSEKNKKTRKLNIHTLKKRDFVRRDFYLFQSPSPPPPPLSILFRFQFVPITLDLIYLRASQSNPIACAIDYGLGLGRSSRSSCCFSDSPDEADEVRRVAGRVSTFELDGPKSHWYIGITASDTSCGSHVKPTEATQ